MKAQVHLVVAFAVLVGGCSETSLRADGGEDTALSVDSGVDASVRDGGSGARDASPSDTNSHHATDALAGDVLEVADAWEADDAWVRELCDGADDDLDGRVDEGPTDCPERLGEGSATCQSGRCLCRGPAAVPHTGAHDDCNGDLGDGCETALDTESDCGECGVRCDVVSRCTDSPVGGLACRPVGILDLSVSREWGDITCIVTVDFEVICRGPNTEHAISDVDPESAVLDWTRTPLPLSSTVRAWQRRREDGLDVLSICALALDGQIVCRGDNGTGLLGYGDSTPRPGNHVIDIPAVVDDFHTWRGQGYGRAPTRRVSDVPPVLYEGDVYRWGQGYVPTYWQSDVAWLAVSEIGLARRVSRGPRQLFWRLDEEPWPAPSWFDAFDGRLFSSQFDRRGCSADPGDPRDVGCGGPTDLGHRSGRRTVPSGIALDTFPTVMVAPGPDGRLQACVYTQRGIDGRARPPRAFCDAVDDIIDSGSDSITPMTEHPELAGSRGQGPQTRTDWQAICVIESPEWWQCYGSHGGWGGPSP
ncbi:MAG: hypothetical protein K1X94_17225 [Sandaracinaceae bacterium]|nr:hypothetical protein [Sandaracinaceae bacterium]